MNMNNAESDIARLARNSRALVSNSSRLLASNFVPGPGDVICSRGKEAMVHVSANAAVLRRSRAQFLRLTVLFRSTGGKQDF